MVTIAESSQLDNLAALTPRERRVMIANIVYKQFVPRIAFRISAAMAEVHQKTVESAMLTTITGRPSQTFEGIDANIAQEVTDLYHTLVTLLDAYDK